jgi:hypothetical protein
MKPLRAQLEGRLEATVRVHIAGVSGSCAALLEHRAALWTFLDEDGVEPTNNHAERELRALVPWRKRSFGSQSERGDQFAERIMAVVHTARKQGTEVLEFLVSCCIARLDGREAPSLLPTAKRSACSSPALRHREVPGGLPPAHRLEAPCALPSCRGHLEHARCRTDHRRRHGHRRPGPGADRCGEGPSQRAHLIQGPTGRARGRRAPGGVRGPGLPSTRPAARLRRRQRDDS